MGLTQSLCLSTFSASPTVSASLNYPLVGGTVNSSPLEQIFEALETEDPTTFARTLGKSRFDLTALDESTGQTLLHRAIELGREEITEIVLRRTAEDLRAINLLDRKRYTPLMQAAVMRNVG